MPVTEQMDQPTMTAESDEELSREEYQKLLELYDESMRNLTEGEIVPGRVIGITSNSVIIDVGYKSEGLIAIEEFLDRDGNRHGRGRRGGRCPPREDRGPRGPRPAVPHQGAAHAPLDGGREGLQGRARSSRGRVIDRIKGGLTVDVGLRAFLPGSLVDIKPVKNLESLRGQELEFKVISLDRRRNNIVLSRKAVLETELAKKKAETLKRLEEGARLKGVVKNITDYGVFIDLGGIDGLLHITDISWGRVNHPSEHFTVGDEVEVVVLKFDPETERVSLGYKQKSEDPWTLVDKKYPDRLARPRQGGVAGRLRRLRRDRGGGRGSDPRQRDVVDQEGRQPGQDPGGGRTRSRRSSPSSTWTSGASACRCARPSATRGRSSAIPIPRARSSRARSAT